MLPTSMITVSYEASPASTRYWTEVPWKPVFPHSKLLVVLVRYRVHERRGRHRLVEGWVKHRNLHACLPCLQFPLFNSFILLAEFLMPQPVEMSRIVLRE